MKNHRLYEIDLERERAFCTVCGYVDIYIPKTRTKSEPTVTCINKARERNQEKVERYEERRDGRASQSDRNPRHTLSDIDPDLMLANCVHCGPTDILKSNKDGKIGYICATRNRAYAREYRRANYVARPSNPHALSEIDEENGTAICAKCGQVQIEIWYGNKKTNRRCINVAKELLLNKNRGKAKENVTTETV
jgi:hypothetical protein